MAEDDGYTIRIIVSEEADISDRLRVSLDALAAAVAEEELGPDVEGFAKAADKGFKIDVGSGRPGGDGKGGGKLEPIPLQGGCIGNYMPDDGPWTCWINW